MGTLCVSFQYNFYFSKKRNYLYGWVFVTDIAGDFLPLITYFFSAIVLEDH